MPADTLGTLLIYSINFLSAPFSHKLNDKSDRCTGRPGCLVSDCLNGWDFASDRIYLVMMDGAKAQQREREGRKEPTALYHGVLYNAHL